MMTCPACAAPVPEGARFCPACGHGLTVRADERRVVTVVFADLVGFTSLSETADPEHVKNLVDRCFERLVADVTAFGGRVDKIVGDALVALFGAPTAHEDDAERAVRAALQLQQTLAGAAADVGRDVQLRVGVNTGEVLVGALRAGGDYTAMGDVVNTASRLQTAAQPGQVLVGPATHAATRDVVSYRELGPLVVRGRDEPVHAWLAEAVLAPPGHRPRRRRMPLVGRQSEMAMMGHALEGAIERRRAHLVLLLGEAGVGKSRLVEELAERAACEHHAEVLQGRCVPYGEANPWWPVAEALRQAVRIEPTDSGERATEKARKGAALALAGLAPAGEEPDPDEVQRVADGILHLLGVEGRLSGVDPARARDEAVRAVLLGLEGLVRQQPLVVALSDIHWADDSVLDLIDRLLDRMRGQPFLIAATARPELAERWSPRAGRHNSLVIQLEPLDAEEAGQLLATVLESEPSPELRSLLIERSGGNPLFLEELAALLGQSGGSLAHPAGQLPATLRGLVSARLDALSPAERSVLDDAAVLGRTGPVEILAAVAEARGQADAAGVVRALAAADVLAVEDGDYEFKSDLVREVAYGTLTKAERARRHAGVATWLTGYARSLGREDEGLDQLAHHFGVAAELAAELGPIDGVPADIAAQAVAALDRAACRAESREWWLDSVRLWDRAAQLAPRDGAGGGAWRRAVLGRARARAAMRQGDDARADVAMVLADAEAAGDRAVLAQALTVQGVIERNEGQAEASVATLDRAVAEATALGDDDATADALRERGMSKNFVGAYAEAEDDISLALEAFRARGDRRGEAWALQNLAWASFSAGHHEVAERRLLKSAEAFTAAGDHAGLGWATGLLGWVRYFQGRLDEADEIASGLVEANSRGEVTDRWALGMMEVLLASVRLWKGRPGDAIDQARAARRLFVEIHDRWAETQAIVPLAWGLVASGRVAEGQAVVDEALALAEAGELRSDMVNLLAANIALALGEAGEGLEAIRAGLGHSVDPAQLGQQEAYALWALALAQSGRGADAVEAMERALALPGDADGGKQAGGPAASALAVAALVRAAAGDCRGAVAAADALVAGGLGSYLDRIRARVGAGLALARAGQAAEAAAHLDAALALADGTADRLSQALVRLARARGAAAVGAPTAAQDRAEAAARLDALGVEAAGWSTLFGAAAGA
jgi:class 3 adenylate cyclase/tetratricopeptide (TPR) repeat protein